jgi:hypothetical protein
MLRAPRTSVIIIVVVFFVVEVSMI